MRTRSHRLFFLPIIFVLVALAGCMSSPLQREKVTQKKGIEIVSIPAPPLDVPTFLQAWVNTGTAGFVQAAIAKNQKQSEVPQTGQGLPDFSSLVASKLENKLKGSWLPPATYSANSQNLAIEPGTARMQVELLKYEISTGWRHLLIVAKVSIVDGTENPLWAELSGYGGLVRGGERIDLDQVMSDPSQLLRELDRAAEWIATDIVRQLK